jgi:hypothetical protein
VGTWYKWGGDDPSGFDCSGYVVECLQAAGLLNTQQDLGAQALYRKYPSVNFPQPGCLAFWGAGPNAIGHVELVVEVVDGTAYTLGAKGGGPKTLTVEDAIRQNAFIKLRPVLGPGARTDFVGYVDPFLVRGQR